MQLALRHAAALGVLFIAPLQAYACSSCGCTLSTDWDSQGFATKPGFRVDLRYDYINQSELRTGTGTVDRADYPLPQEREIEKGTINRYTTLGVEYTGDGWGLNVSVPYVDRPHSTFAEGETEVSTSHSSSLGDVRAVFQYQGLTPEKNVGIQIGVKLPTGSHDVKFATGPEAGEPLDRGLQPGTGTTDVLLGAFKFAPLSQNWDYFAQAMVQVALGSSDDFRPGNSLNVNGGLRYMGNPRLMPELQLNTRWVKRDSGANADVENSGGTVAYLSPGATLMLNKKTHLFGFVQLPVYQRVNGFQLAPHYLVSVGARYDF
jgi:Putative MetA-pathway of phenol degradation